MCSLLALTTSLTLRLPEMKNVPKKTLSLLIFIIDLPNQKAQLETTMSSTFPDKVH